MLSTSSSKWYIRPLDNNTNADQPSLTMIVQILGLLPVKDQVKLVELLLGQLQHNRPDWIVTLVNQMNRDGLSQILRAVADRLKNEGN